MQKKLIDKLALLEIKDKKLLVSLNIGSHVWYCPGGQREPGETDQEALIREIKEELSVDIIPETITYYGTFEAPSHDRPHDLLVRYTCYTASYKGFLQPGTEIEKIDFFPYNKKNLISTVDKTLFDDLKQKGLIE